MTSLLNPISGAEGTSHFVAIAIGLAVIGFRVLRVSGDLGLQP